MRRSVEEQLFSIRDTFTYENRFTVTSLALETDDCPFWVEMSFNPERFLPRIFDGHDWARPGTHPKPGQIKIVRALRGNDDVVRLIGRQERGLFAAPWLDWPDAPNT